MELPIKFTLYKQQRADINTMLVSKKIVELLRFFVFERTKHQPRRNLRSYLVLQRLCNEAALSPCIDAFWF